MLVPMRRIEILAPRADTDALLRVLHRAGTVQLVPFEPTSGMAAAVFGREASSSAVDRVVRLEAQTASLAEALVAAGAPPALVSSLWPIDLAALSRRVRDLVPVREQLSELQARHQRLLAEQARLAGYRQIVESLRPVLGRLPALRGYGSTAIIIHARYRGVLSAVREELESITGGHCETIAADIEGDRVAGLLLYPLASSDRVRTLLGGRDLEELTLPEELSGLPFDELLARLAGRIRQAQDEVEQTEAALAALAETHGPIVAALRLVLADRLDEARALQDAGTSDHLVILSGWVPVARLAALRARLAREIGPQVWIEECEPGAAERAGAPVAIQNRRILQAFAPLASFISLPRYGTLDPTPMLAITFPVFVGLMVGDVGYGLLLLGLLMLARRRWRHARWMAIVTPIAWLAALSTIVFGFLFGEAFGNAGHDLIGLRPILFDRHEAVTDFLLLALAIGAGQIAIGLVLGIVNAALQHRTHELVSRVGLLVVLVATLISLGWLAGFVPLVGGQLALGALAVAIAVLIASMGLAGPIEAMGMLGNVLSYARLMAIGMASVMLAITANQLGGAAGNVLVGVIVAGLVHALNLALGFVDSSIQGLRLHYVEFFPKFLEPGGTPYRPFVSVLGAPAAPVTQQGGV
jgi:V/A-type H+/Na+-transporting ATPase subunit I